LLCGTVGGAVMLYFQNLDVVRPSLVASIKNYVPHPAEETSDDPLTSAWDDVQKQVRKKNLVTRQGRDPDFVYPDTCSMTIWPINKTCEDN
jgi:hypothetical protein